MTRSRRIAAVQSQEQASADKPSRERNPVEVTPGGPEVVEATAQCWNCGSIKSVVVDGPVPDGERDLVRVRECSRCGTVYRSRERLRVGVVA